MKNNKKIIALLLSTLLLGCMILTGCGTKGTTAVESAQILFDLYIKQDTTNVEKITITKEESESIIKIQQESMKKMTKTLFTSAGLTISDEDLDNICKSQLSAMAKVTPNIELVSESDGIAEVKVKSTYIDIVGADTKAADDAIKFGQNSGISDEQELRTKMTAEYIKNLINGFNSLEPSTETKEETFKFKKDEKSKVYVPDNIVEFSTDLAKLIQK